MYKIIYLLTLFCGLVIAQNGTIQIYSAEHGELKTVVWADSSENNYYKIILPFKINGSPYLLLYNREEGQITVKKRSNYSNVVVLKNMPTDWEQIIAVNTGDTLTDYLFVYNRIQNKAFVYSFDSLFNFSVWGQYSFPNSFGETPNKYLYVIPAFMNDSGKIGAMMYSPFGPLDRTNYFSFIAPPPTHAIGEFYEFFKNPGGSGENRVLVVKKRTFTDWRPSWDIIRAINLPGYKNIFMFYDSFNSVLEFYKLTETTFELQKKYHGNIRRNWKSITAGKYLTGNDIFFYDKQKHVGEFYHLDYNYQLELISHKEYFKENWSIVESIPGIDGDDVLFYRCEDNQELCIPTYDSAQQPVHPDVLYENNIIKLVFTPYTFLNDQVENPSYLYSQQDNVFKPFPRVNNPLIHTPMPLFAYNNDPTFFKEGDTTYLFYLTTYTDTINGFTDLHLLKSTNDFQNFSSDTVFRQPSNDILFYMYSPSFLKDTSQNLYYMFWTNYFGTIFYQTSNSINQWVKPKYAERKEINLSYNRININDNNVRFCPWHIKVLENKHDGYLYMLIAGKFESSFPAPAPQINLNLYIARNRQPGDYSHWILYPEPLLDKDKLGYSCMYRSSGLFSKDLRPSSQPTALDIYYSFYKGQKPGMGVKKNVLIKNEWFDLRDNSLNKSVTGNHNIQFSISTFPNPFNPSTTICYSVPESGLVTIKIYDILGREILTPVNDYREKGKYNVLINLSGFASGIYFYMIKNEYFSAINKMVYIK